MRKLLLPGVVGSMTLLSIGSVSAESLEILTNGQRRGGLTPRSEPYASGGPSVAVYLTDQKNVKTMDGQAVTGFEFTAWREGKGTRVMVAVLIPRSGAPNTYLPGGKRENLARSEFATHFLEEASELRVTKMQELGVAPMVLRSSAK
jgi:hypothetical protein